MLYLRNDLILTGLSLMVSFALAEELPGAFWSASQTTKITKSSEPPILYSDRKRGSPTGQVKVRERCPATHYGQVSKDICLHWLELAGATTDNDVWNIADGSQINCLLLVTNKCCAKREIIPVLSDTENKMVRILIKYDENAPLGDGKTCPSDLAADKGKKYYKYTFYRSAQELIGYFISEE